MDEVEALAKSRRGSMVAAAGCGKTELIARAVQNHGGGMELVLTHTNAGVEALRARLHRFGVASSKYRVDTLAGWALRLSAAFPYTSGLPTSRPRAHSEYVATYVACAQLLGRKPIRDIIRASYSGVYVDEYQDCTVEQHALVVRLSEIIPCRVVGDPLQAIFNFGKNTPVDWSDHVRAVFEDVVGPTTPWRWRDGQPALGEWLLEIRKRLTEGNGFDLQGAPVRWVEAGDERSQQLRQVATCFEVVKLGGSVIAVHQHPTQCQSLARRLGGAYSCVEPVEAKDLYQLAERIDGSAGLRRAVAVIDFASLCMTKVKGELRTIREALESDRVPTVRKHAVQLQALLGVASATSLAPVGAALLAIKQMSGVTPFRRELLGAMRRAVDAAARGDHPSLAEAAWAVRNRARHQGRFLARCAVGTTLLVKGLQFDHAVVLDADCHDAKNLYVAMTRGAKSLTIVSRSRSIQPVQQSNERGAGEVRESPART